MASAMERPGRLGIWQICGQAASSASKSMEDPLVQQQAAEGAILRAQAAFVAYPLDVLKTQVQSGHPRYNRLSRLPCLLKDYRLKIFRGYPGVGANSLLMGGLMFGGYRFFDNFWALYHVPDYWRPAVAGGSIGALCGLAATPLEQVKTIMALQETWLKERKITKRIYTSVHHGAWAAPAGLKFYAATPLVIRTALFDSQFFYNSRLREWVANGGCPPSLHFLVGTVGFMLAGLVAATINYPFDRVKGHMMGRAFQASIGEQPKESTYGAFAAVVKRHGVGGLFHGLPTRSVLHAVVWCVVGAGREFCEWAGLRERAKQRSAELGCSRTLSA